MNYHINILFSEEDGGYIADGTTATPPSMQGGSESLRPPAFALPPRYRPHI